MKQFAYDKVDWPSVFQTLSEGGRGILTKTALELGIDKSWLSKIFKRHLKDPDFDPRTMHWGGHNQTFTKKEEQIMTKFLIEELASDGLAMPEEEIRRVCMDHGSSQHPYQTRQNFFYASKGWMYNFKNLQL